MYRIRQFVLYILSFFKKVDIDFIKFYLDEREMLYFNKLLKTEKQHCIRVAKKCIEVFRDFNIYDDELYIVVKMCLMHDVGKSYSSINLFLKPFIVLMSYKRIFRKVIFFINKERIIKYFNHSKYSFNILRTFDYSPDILSSIRYHHSDKKNSNKYVKLLKYCDSVS